MLTLKIEERSRFDMIASGVQKEVYSTHDEQQMLFNLWGKDVSGWKNPQYVSFESGDEPDTRTCVALCTLAMGEGYPEWGAVKGVTYLIIKVQTIIEVSEPIAEISNEAMQALEKAEEDIEKAEEALREAEQVIEETSELVEEEEAETEEEEIAPVKETVPLEDGKVLIREETVDGCPVGLVISSDVGEEPVEETVAVAFAEEEEKEAEVTEPCEEEAKTEVAEQDTLSVKEEEEGETE